MQNGILLEKITREELFNELRSIVSEILENQLKPEPQKEYFTKKEAAQKLRVSLPTLHRLTISGTIKGYRIGRRVLYRTDEIDLAVKNIASIKYKRS